MQDKEKVRFGMSQKLLLITGFDPFGGEKTNPSYEAVKLLPDKLGNIAVIKKELPTSFSAAPRLLYEEIESINPDFVILTGQAGGRSAVTPERVAINCADASIPDNDGACPCDKTIYEDAPAAYFSTLPIKKMVSALKDGGIPSAVSNTAGTYVCNRVMYEALHIAHKRAENGKKSFLAGFIHVPYIPSQVKDRQGVPSMELEEIAKGLTLAIETLTE